MYSTKKDGAFLVRLPPCHVFDVLAVHTHAENIFISHVKWTKRIISVHTHVQQSCLFLCPFKTKHYIK